MGSRVKKYRMKAIPSAFSEKGGYSAQFVGDGYSVDARTEILPSVILANGVQVGEGTAWDLVTAFLKACAQRAANTGETVNVGSLMTFGLSIRGWYENKDSKAAKDAVRVTATLLGELRPTVAFSMSNELAGATLTLYTVMSEGCGIGHVRQGAAFRINGKWLQMLDGDTVTASVKAESGETVTATCPVTDSDDDHIDATLPAALSDASLAGREVRFTVRGRCGDPDAGVQEKSIAATLEAGESPTPTGDEPVLERGYSEGEGHSDGQVYPYYPFILQGEHLTDAEVKIGYVEGGTPREEVVPDEKLTVSDSVIRIASDSVELEDAIAAGGTVTFTVTTPNGSDSYEAEVQE